MPPLVETTVADAVATLRLNKPRALNALCAEMAGQLLDALNACAMHPKVRVVLLTGNGRGFCAGSDLKAQAPVTGLSTEERGDLLLSRYFNPLLRTLHDLALPIVVGINGLAVGGGVGLALSGDIAIARSSAVFQLTFGPRLGLVPDMGCTWWLPRLIGHARALPVAMTGEPITARTAQEWGLIWRVVPDSEFDSEVMRVASRLAEGPCEAFVATRGLMDAAMQTDLPAQLEREREVQIRLMSGAKFAEGVRAFKEMREP